MTTTAPRIYVACLASYNGGTLHGVWIDASQSADDILSEAENMLIDSPEPDAEEWAIHDYEGFEGLIIDESASFETVSELAQLLELHGPAYAAYVGYVGDDYATAEGFEESYAGEWDSEGDYAEQFIDDVYNLDGIMGNLSYYFDYEKFAHDLFVNDMYAVDSPAGVYVFRR